MLQGRTLSTPEKITACRRTGTPQKVTARLNVGELVLGKFVKKVADSPTMPATPTKTAESKTMSPSTTESSKALMIKYRRCHKRWARALPVPPKLGSLLKRGSWLTASAKSGTFGIGCMVCCLYLKESAAAGRPINDIWVKATCAYANVAVKGALVDLGNLKKHHDSDSHRFAVAELSNAKGKELLVNAWAPSQQEFEDVWAHARSGGSASLVPRVGQRQKVET